MWVREIKKIKKKHICQNLFFQDLNVLHVVRVFLNDNLSMKKREPKVVMQVNLRHNSYFNLYVKSVTCLEDN